MYSALSGMLIRFLLSSNLSRSSSALEAPPTEQAVGVEVNILALALRTYGETLDTRAFNPLSHVR